MKAVEHVYRYAEPSRLFGRPGQVALGLATSSGWRDGRAAGHPYFFDGYVGEPEQTATALLIGSSVAATRYYLPPSVTAAKIKSADPVVTSNGDRLRFETFSACGGIYTRLDIMPDGLESQPLATGTTNVDFNTPMRRALAGVGPGEPLHLRIGDAGVSATTVGVSETERRVRLPERWLRGFGEVQLMSSQATAALHLDRVTAVAFVRSLPKSDRAVLWAVPGRRGPALVASPRAGAVPVVGPKRLRVLEPLLRFATGLVAFSRSDDPVRPDLATVWVLSLPGARFTVALTAEMSRAFSGEGGVLLDLADVRAYVDADALSSGLAWQAVLDLNDLGRDAGIKGGRLAAAVNVKSASGGLGFDAAAGTHFHRELPFDPDAFETMHPRLRDARRLVAAEAVTITDTAVVVRSGSVDHRVTMNGDVASCTCQWWFRHQGRRGPCKHVLAAYIVARA